jgi:excisionase family DNA binding protein
MSDHWVTVNEAARLSGYHAERIRELIRDGKIVATKKGNSWWVDSKSVLTYVKDAQKTKDKRFGPRS